MYVYDVHLYICTLIIGMCLFVSLNDFKVKILKFYRSKLERKKYFLYSEKKNYGLIHINKKME